MVKFYTTNYAYDYSFSAVSLAYFLRYPNPYSRHVSSTDTLSTTFDPETHRLTTVRLHVKRSRVPKPVLKLLGKGAIGSDEDGSTQSFILESSVVDIKNGTMETESRNLDWDHVLAVTERQSYRRSAATESDHDDRTDVSVSVTLKSRIGEQIRRRRQRWGEQANAISVTGASDSDASPKQGWLASWSSSAVRSAIESISLQRTERSQPKARQGMSVVLDRLRTGGLEGVLEGMRRDRGIEL